MQNFGCPQQNSRMQNCQQQYDIDNMPLAMAYVPWQHFTQVYEPDKALAYGTIFPELNKPFLGKRGAMR